MKLEKIKEILKNKKLMAISGVLIITIAGVTILYSNLVQDNKTLVGNQKNEKILEDEKGIKSEELTIEDISENKEVVEVYDNHVHDENCNHNNENSTSHEKESTSESVINKSNVDNVDNNKESNSSNSTINNISNGTSNSVVSNSSQNSGSITNSKPSTGFSSSSSSSQTHAHNWIPITSVIQHKEQGHYEKVLISEAWTEEVPVYEDREVMICNDCGAELNASNCYDHVEEHLLNGGKGSWREEWKRVQVGTNKINHDAVYENKWVVDKATWNETVITGYKCSICGETK